MSADKESEPHVSKSFRDLLETDGSEMHPSGEGEQLSFDAV